MTDMIEPIAQIDQQRLAEEFVAQAREDGVRDDTGPGRLLDMVEGRSRQALTTWLANRPQAWRDHVEVVAMDEFTGFKTATVE